MAGANDFTGLVPGFEFLQGLVRNAGAGLPDMSQWIAPTLDPQELEKRIGELRTVQFWLDQNAKLLGTTIQALEVQRLTLSTLKTMNLPLAELRKSFEMPTPSATAETPAAESAPDATATAAADPMRWWGALTQQFGQIAAQALKDVAVEPPAPAPAAPAAARKSAPRKPRRAAAAKPPAPRRKAAKG